MINLLPPELKASMTYGRRNRLLIRWLIATCVGILGIGAVVLFGQFYINMQINAYAQEVQRGKDALKEQQLEGTVNRINEIDSSVKLALQVLSKEIRFSKLLQGIGSAMPPGSALQNLSITNVEGALDLQAVAINYQTATQVQVNLEDPRNGVFETADIISVACGAQDEAGQYPCQVTLRALFAKDSPYLFSTKSTGGDQP